MNTHTRIDPMAEESIKKPMPVCEMCWLDEHARWEPESMNESGSIMMKLTGVDTPEIIDIGCVEVCCMCGTITIAGIYDMRDPSEVYFLGDESSKDFEFNFNNIIEED